MNWRSFLIPSLNPARDFGRAPASGKGGTGFNSPILCAYSRPQYALIIMGSTAQIKEISTSPVGRLEAG